MSRTTTAAERAAVAALRHGAFSKFEVQDADLVYRDYTQYLRTDWFTRATIRENIDSNTWSLNATLLRETGTLSLSPFVAASLVNRNAGGTYATAIDAWRKWRLSVAVMREGYPPTGADWKEIAQGRIDIIEWSGDLIQVTGRGEEAVLLDFWIATERQYGSGGGTAQETVIQSMNDNNLNALSPALYTPVSPGYNMLTWVQPKGNLFPADVAVASKSGSVLRYRYDASDVNRLTLFKPNRAAAPGSEVWTLGPSEITDYQKVAIDKQGIRNFIKLRYAHPTLGTQTVIYPHMAGVGTVACVAGVATFSNSQAGIVKSAADNSNTEIIVAGIAYTVTGFNGTTGATLLSQLQTGGVPTFTAAAFTLHDTLSGAGTTASLSRFGRIDMELDLAFDTQVTDPTNAQAMCDVVGSDMEFPDLEQTIKTRGAWFIQLHDYGKFEANPQLYDSAQYGGVTSIEHLITDGTIETTLGVRGKPQGGYERWRQLARDTAPSTGSLSLLFAECLTKISAPAAGTVTVTVTANPNSPPQQVQLVAITGSATLNSGTPVGTWVTPNGINNVWVFNRGAINSGAGQVQFRAGNTSAFPNDDKFVTIEEQGRDTVSLASRARVIATAPGTLTVRVAVADPFPQGAASATIGYSELGLGGATSPVTGQTVTPAATLTEAAGTFVDYTVTRPAFGAGAGRITFTATAANRTSDSDAVDVPEVDRDTQSLSMRILRVSETADQVVSRVEVISPNAGATITIAYNNGGLTVAPASGGTFTSTTSFGTTAHIDYTITRDTANGTPRKVTFTASAAGFIDATDSVDVPITSTRFRAKAAETVSLANNTPRFFQFSSEVYDVGNLHDNVTANTRFVVPVGGDVGAFVVTGSVSFANNATGYRSVGIYKNGAITDAVAVVQAVAAGVLTAVAVIFVDSAPAAGDYYELLATQTSGGNLSTTGTLTATHLP